MIKGRFAPSPTGRMHLGNVYAALLSWLSARSQGGSWLLRIEDIDPGRSRKEYTEQIKQDLEWLGLDWDEYFVQSERGEIYTHYLNILKEQGLTYPCYCSRADIMATQAPHESDGRVVYAGTCRPSGRSREEIIREKVGNRKPATRVMVPDEEIPFVDGLYGPQSINLAKHCGDFIVRRSDGAWAYQLAVVVDDALMGVSEVVRGCDLLQSVPQQLYLYRLLGLKAPGFTHIPLLVNENGQRLSKRDKSLDLGELSKRFSAQQIIGLLANVIGLTDTLEPISTQDLIGLFDWSKIQEDNIIINNKVLQQ